MIETLLFYAAWAALATGIVTSVLITQGAIRQLLRDSADGSETSHEESDRIAAPPVERHV